MGAKGICIAEECHVVPLLYPGDQDGGKSTDVIDLGKFAHATILITCGATNADAGNITLEACDNSTPTTHTEVAFSYYACTTDSSDVLGARTAATTAGIDVSANDNIMYVIELDAAELPAGKPYFRLSWSDAGGATYGQITAILSGARYGADQSPTAAA